MRASGRGTLRAKRFEWNFPHSCSSSGKFAAEVSAGAGPTVGVSTCPGLPQPAKESATIGKRPRSILASRFLEASMKSVTAVFFSLLLASSASCSKGDKDKDTVVALAAPAAPTKAKPAAVETVTFAKKAPGVG